MIEWTRNEGDLPVYICYARFRLIFLATQTNPYTHSMTNNKISNDDNDDAYFSAQILSQTQWISIGRRHRIDSILC